MKPENEEARKLALAGPEEPKTELELSIAEARKQAELAYEFVPNSYTHSAMLATRAAERALADADE
jgi:hypothetical protein